MEIKNFDPADYASLYDIKLKLKEYETIREELYISQQKNQNNYTENREKLKDLINYIEIAVETNNIYFKITEKIRFVIRYQANSNEDLRLSFRESELNPKDFIEYKTIINDLFDKLENDIFIKAIKDIINCYSNKNNNLDTNKLDENMKQMKKHILKFDIKGLIRGGSKFINQSEKIYILHTVGDYLVYLINNETKPRISDEKEILTFVLNHDMKPTKETLRKEKMQLL